MHRKKGKEEKEMRTEPRVIYYKSVRKDNGQVAYATWQWVTDEEKFLKDKTGKTFEAVKISKEEFDELKKEK